MSMLRTDTLAQYRTGFTLVELIVVIAVLGVIVTFTVSSMMRYGARQQYTAAVTEVTALVEDAHAAAQTARDGYVAYSVQFATSSAVRFAGTSYSSSTSPAQVVVTVPSSVTLTPVLTGGTTTVSFARITGEPSATGTVLIVDARTAATTTFTIYPSGLVQ